MNPHVLIYRRWNGLELKPRGKPTWSILNTLRTPVCGSRGPSHRPRLSPHLEVRRLTGQFSRSTTTEKETDRRTDRQTDRVPVHGQSLPIHVLLLHKLQSQRAVLLKSSTNKNTEGTQPITAALGGSRRTAFDRKRSRQRATHRQWQLSKSIQSV